MEAKATTYHLSWNDLACMRGDWRDDYLANERKRYRVALVAMDLFSVSSLIEDLQSIIVEYVLSSHLIAEHIEFHRHSTVPQKLNLDKQWDREFTLYYKRLHCNDLDIARAGYIEDMRIYRQMLNLPPVTPLETKRFRELLAEGAEPPVPRWASWYYTTDNRRDLKLAFASTPQEDWDRAHRPSYLR